MLKSTCNNVLHVGVKWCKENVKYKALKALLTQKAIMIHQRRDNAIFITDVTII